MKSRFASKGGLWPGNLHFPQAFIGVSQAIETAVPRHVVMWFEGSSPTAVFNHI